MACREKKNISKTRKPPDSAEKCHSEKKRRETARVDSCLEPRYYVVQWEQIVGALGATCVQHPHPDGQHTLKDALREKGDVALSIRLAAVFTEFLQ